MHASLEVRGDYCMRKCGAARNDLCMRHCYALLFSIVLLVLMQCRIISQEDMLGAYSDHR